MSKEKPLKEEKKKERAERDKKLDVSSTSQKRGLLRVQKRIENKKPKFIRQEGWRYKRAKTGWRKPKGIDSKMRMRKKGWPILVKIGYRSSRQVRDLHPSGFKELPIHKPKDLEGVNPKEYAVRIAHSVGSKKRLQILEIAKEQKFHVLNPGKGEKS